LVVHVNSTMLTLLERTKTIKWNGQEVGESFECKLETAVPSQRAVTGRADVVLNGALIASLDFSLPIARRAANKTRKKLKQTRREPRTAFASYASANRADVLRCVQGMSKSAPDLDVFVDVDKLRSGDDWASKLYAYIATSDIFYLFWSQAASESEWVKREWQYALVEKGIRFIDPVPLENPQLAPPPKELSNLHFNDRYLMFILAQKAIDPAQGGPVAAQLQ